MPGSRKHPLRYPAFGLAVALPLGVLAVAGALPDLPWPGFEASPSPAATRVPDALGASFARSVAEAGQRVLHLSSNAAGREACSAAIARSDAAALRAAEAARGTARNVQDIQLVLAAEDAYLEATRRCVRDARPVCMASQRRVAGCELVAIVTDADLASARALRGSHVK